MEIKAILTRFRESDAARNKKHQTVKIRARPRYFRPLMRIVHRATSRQLLAKDEFPRTFAEEGRLQRGSITKSINRSRNVRFLLIGFSCAMQDARCIARGFSSRDSRTGVSVKINGPRARGEMSFRRGAKNG